MRVDPPQRSGRRPHGWVPRRVASAFLSLLALEVLLLGSGLLFALSLLEGGDDLDEDANVIARTLGALSGFARHHPEVYWVMGVGVLAAFVALNLVAERAHERGSRGASDPVRISLRPQR